MQTCNLYKVPHRNVVQTPTSTSIKMDTGPQNEEMTFHIYAKITTYRLLKHRRAFDRHHTGARSLTTIPSLFPSTRSLRAEGSRPSLPAEDPPLLYLS